MLDTLIPASTPDYAITFHVDFKFPITNRALTQGALG